jgi:hypothetical protein
LHMPDSALMNSLWHLSLGRLDIAVALPACSAFTNVFQRH